MKTKFRRVKFNDLKPGLQKDYGLGIGTYSEINGTSWSLKMEIHYVDNAKNIVVYTDGCGICKTMTQNALDRKRYFYSDEVCGD